ncbi:NAD-dependent epimerase/dehydratase family protein [Amycolatopsis sp. PS_44_ISF1]|uniref:NAD-dependent epimerase/dehydratase family protein n=1 Tax=Amycolatopsis sp. PS_44_ISF1 TaxID=2974917 RepID=UPI0028E02C89|nr:NAD-dependent epimerase/dehydratase family protein [Amycolatopsis sp. PS_44_ISF1]MDT8912255.1 NAD-dependent epimerase/dehydratase family protein [Amycolatopsis sp. PS_44_ISF1]
MDLAGKRILVVGGAGFIGSNVVDRLLKTEVAEVIIYDSLVRGALRNLADASSDSRLTILDDQPDIRDLDRLTEAMAGIDGVFNLAAIGIVASNESPEDAFTINVTGNWNVFRAAAACGVQKVVHSSSASVYGQPQIVPMTEEHPYNNRTLYGANKIAAEHLLLACGELDPLEWVALRYFNVYGPRQDSKGAYTSVLHKVLDRLEAGEPPVIFGDGSQMMDFVHVTDVARANVRAMEADAPSGFFNVCSGTGTTIREVVAMLSDLTGIRIEPVYREAAIPANLVTKRIGGPEKSAELLSFSTGVSLEDGLRSLVEWRERSRATATTGS